MFQETALEVKSSLASLDKPSPDYQGTSNAGNDPLRKPEEVIAAICFACLGHYLFLHRVLYVRMRTKGRRKMRLEFLSFAESYDLGLGHKGSKEQRSVLVEILWSAVGAYDGLPFSLPVPDLFPRLWQGVTTNTATAAVHVPRGRPAPTLTNVKLR